MTIAYPFTPEKPLRLGTRGSKMALIQSEKVKKLLIEAHPQLDGAIEIVVITTTGDKVRDRRLSEVGGKGMFIRELEIALEDDKIDAAIHSMKDVPSLLLAPFHIVAILERDAPWDVFISTKSRTLDDLPPGSTVGTSAPRREALTRALRPDLNVVLFRGNADTRLEKMQRGEVDATYLSLAGLQRIERYETQFKVLTPQEMLPAAGQGAIGIEIMNDDETLVSIFAAINHLESWQCVTSERAALAVLSGDCHSPLAAYATIEGNEITLSALAAKPDGSQIIRYNEKAPIDSYLSLGLHVGQTIKEQLPDDFFADDPQILSATK